MSLVVLPLAADLPVARADEGFGAGISGTVTGPSGEPVPDFSVVAVGETGSGSVATTGADGTYTISGLAAGAYKVGFRPAIPGSPYLEEWYLDKPGWDSADPLTLESDQQLTGLDVQVARGATLSGTVTGTNGTGRPGGALAGVVVTANGPTYRSATTGADGSYRIAGLAPGAYEVSFSPTSGPHRPEYHAGKATPETADPVMLSFAEDRVIDALLSTGASISGRVTGVNGEAVADVPVIVNNPYVNRSTTTAADGTYTFYDLAAGEYKVGFSPPWISRYVNEWYEDKPDPATATPVKLATGERRFGVDAALTKRASVSGTVTGPDGTPLAGIPVRVLGPSFGTTKTASDGTWVVVDLMPGEYTVGFEPAPNSPYLGEFYDNASDASTATAVTLVSGEERTGIDAELASAGTITGTVTAPGGFPLAGISVYAYGPVTFATMTGPSGTFTLRPPKLGDYKLRFVDDSPNSPYLGEWFDGHDDQSGADALTVVGGETISGVNVTLDRWATVSGTLHGPDGAPIAGAAVTVQAASGITQSVPTQPDGTYAVTHLRPGDYTLTFESPDSRYLPLTLTTVLEQGATATLDGQLLLAAQITGKVTSSRFRTVGEVTVHALDADGRIVAAAAVAADGTYVIGGLAPGSYVISFAPAPGNPHRPEYWNDAKTFAKADPVTVAEGQVRTKINAELSA